MNKDTLQRISDHFHIGRIINVETLEFYCKLETSRGTFIVLESSPLTAINSEQERLLKVKSQVNYPVERVLRSGYQGEVSPEYSYAHVLDKYYSIYKLLGQYKYLKGKHLYGQVTNKLF